MPPAGPETAERRARELEGLHGLSRTLDGTLPCEEAVAGALRAVVGLGWFACGEAWLRDDPGGGPRSLGLCTDATCVGGIDAEVLIAALEDGRPRQQEGWRLLPVAGEAVLGLYGGGSVSDAFLAGVADFVGAALQRCRLQGRLAEKEAQRARLLAALLTAQEEERGRIARDLHDQIGQALTALLLGLERQLERPDAAAIAGLRELTAATLADVRRIALDLRPAVLDELGLAAALERFARDLEARYGLTVSVLVDLPSRLPRTTETVLYRVAQEALTNVVRHARAREAAVVATAVGGSLQLVVEDDGVGFDVEALAPAQQIGLLGMRERLELLGGTLRIESSPGSGCGVHARLPL